MSKTSVIYIATWCHELVFARHGVFRSFNRGLVVIIASSFPGLFSHIVNRMLFL